MNQSGCVPGAKSGAFLYRPHRPGILWKPAALTRRGDPIWRNPCTGFSEKKGSSTDGNRIPHGHGTGARIAQPPVCRRRSRCDDRRHGGCGHSEHSRPYDQGIHNSFYYSEEILSQIPHKKSIVVSDRATLFNLLIGLDGYTIATGILNSNLNGDNIVSIPLDIDDEIDIVYLKHEKATLSKMGEKFLDNLVKEVTFDN